MKKKSINYGKWGYLFILPFFIIYFIFSLIPLVDTVRYSFFEYFRSGIKEIGPNFIGMENYISLLKSDMFKYGANTLPYLIMASAFALLFFTMFSTNGPVNSILMSLGWIKAPIDFMGSVFGTRSLIG